MFTYVFFGKHFSVIKNAKIFLAQKMQIFGQAIIFFNHLLKFVTIHIPGSYFDLIFQKQFVGY